LFELLPQPIQMVDAVRVIAKKRLAIRIW